MASSERWLNAVRYASIVMVILALVQYALGLWTNVYGPTSGTNFDNDNCNACNYPASLNWHFMIGDALFLLAIVILVFAVFARQLRLIVPSVVLIVSVYAAGAFGMAFINSSPNNPIYSFGMGIMFLVVLFTSVSILMISWMGRRWPTERDATPSAAAQ